MRLAALIISSVALILAIYAIHSADANLDLILKSAKVQLKMAETIRELHGVGR